MKEAWFDRSFAFDFPIERIGTLCSRLRGAAPRITATLRGLTPKQRTARDGERWSAQEHVGHLFELDGLWLARLEDLANGATTLRAADLSNRSTWDADYNARPFVAVLTAFECRRAELLRELRALDPRGLARTALHPRLQTPMRAIDVAAFAAEHDDHHLAAVEALAARAARDPLPATARTWAAMRTESPMALLERRRMIGDEAMISHITLHKGCKVPVHEHQNEQFACVISGVVRFTLRGGETRDLRAGDVLQLPAWAPHGAEALETAVVLDVFAPPSEKTGIDA
ncbi:MAG: cupin domain-containing protein [Planctomycetes bacterium]|nr:cupin domain-containing protein [Planctomycetota bacterium]